MANTTLQKAGNRLADPSFQLVVLRPTGCRKPFEDALAESGLYPLRAVGIETLQVNVGKLCNMICSHCHVDAGPDRREIMTRETADACIIAQWPSLPEAWAAHLTAAEWRVISRRCGREWNEDPQGYWPPATPKPETYG